MSGLLETAVIVGMFILRLGVPLAIILLVGYWLRRLDAKWEAEAQAQAESNRPLSAKSKSFVQSDEPCWVVKACDETVRADCPAFKQSNLPCWMARRRVDGRLPVACYECELLPFEQTRKLAS